MKVKEYRILSVDDEHDTKYRAWSRIYEYHKILTDLRNLDLPDTATVHNTACGNEPIHMLFADELNQIFPKALHSDIFPLTKAPTVSNGSYAQHNLLKPWLAEPFDIVICISTVEHLPKPRRIEALRYLCGAVAPGGHLFLTFDWPRVVNSEVERFFKAKSEDTPTRLNGGNSPCPDPRYKHLNIIYLHAQKEA